MPVNYDVQISGVREVSLIGTADVSPWQERLAEYDLHPTVKNGNAEIMISGCEGRFKGIRFRELSISVMTSSTPGSSNRDGAFLVQAFNSLRFFAWVERTMFHTPYYFAKLQIETGPPAALVLNWQGQPALSISMHDQPSHAEPSGSRSPVSAGPDGWEGPIHLPRRTSQSSEPLRLFHGKLSGQTYTYPFASSDKLHIQPADGAPVLQWLIESNFQPREWIIRPDATHGKSKTIRRTS